MLRAPLPIVRPFALSVRVPIEVWICLIWSVTWLIGVASGMPISLPNSSSIFLSKIHFLGPVTLAIMLQIALVALVGQATLRRRQSDGFLMIKLFPMVLLATFFHFNFKAWMPLVNPELYDAQYQALDQIGAPLLTSVLVVRSFVAEQLPFDVDRWYSELYFIMFFLTVGVHALTDTAQHQRQVVLGMCLVMVLGALSYWIAPAAGPFLYRDGMNAGARMAQEFMYDQFLIVRTTGVLPDGYFGIPLAAMPSLHTAQSLFFTLCAARSARWLLVFYIPTLYWILIEAVASGWHYLIDLPAGSILAVICFLLATRLVPADR